MSRTLIGRAIRSGEATGIALVSPTPISFLGGVDPDTGRISEPGHPLCGECVTGRVLVFPRGKGSTVGSFVIYRMARSGTAPAAMVLCECEPIVAIGAIMADLPVVDLVDITQIRTGDLATVSGSEVQIG